MSEFDSIEEELKFMADCSDDRGDSETSLMFVRYLAHIRKLNAELAALKAGQGEAAAYVKPDSPIKGHTEFCRHETWMIDEGENIMIAGGWFPLYLSAQPASADAVSVPRELLERLCPVTAADGWKEWNTATAYEAAKELSALLAQSQEVKS